MSLPPPGTPVAPEFVGYRNGRPVRVRFDQQRSAILTGDEEGRPPAALPWTMDSEPLRIERDEFVCQWAPDVAPLRLEVRDDDFGMALAFVEFVNRRRPAGPDPLGEPIPGEPRFQYAVMNVGVLDTPERMSEILARAGSRGWELVTIHDTASNLLTGPAGSFLVLKRAVPDGADVAEWCITLRA